MECFGWDWKIPRSARWVRVAAGYIMKNPDTGATNGSGLWDDFRREALLGNPTWAVLKTTDWLFNGLYLYSIKMYQKKLGLSWSIQLNTDRLTIIYAILADIKVLLHPQKVIPQYIYYPFKSGGTRCCPQESSIFIFTYNYVNSMNIYIYCTYIYMMIYLYIKSMKIHIFRYIYWLVVWNMFYFFIY